MKKKQKGFLVYEKEDAKKNTFFINKLTKELKKYNIILELKYRTEVDGSENIDFVVNRSRDYKLSERYESNGIRVFNNSKITKLGNDKKLSQNLFEKKVPMMPLTEDYPCVIKSVAGHGGSEVFLVSTKEEEYQALETMKRSQVCDVMKKVQAVEFSKKNQDCQEVPKFIRQKVASDWGVDKRVYILGNKIVAAVKRTSDDFRSNFSLGGNASMDEVTEKEKRIVEKILEETYADYIGIDFIYNNGEPVFNEMEDAVGARMLYNSSSIDIIKMLAEHINNEGNI